MRKVSLVGLIFGAVLGVVVALVFGSWIFWLGMGLAIGVFVGAQARRPQLPQGEVARRLSS
ncbi:MAG TPA: hypothetical protein VFT65_04705 [Candidatus Angelobacter sp.]|nr:hypothetical protein [Candidatus Angelobacter sp.]